MNLAKGIKIEDLAVGDGDVAEKGRIALIEFACFLRRGDLAFSSETDGILTQIEFGKRRTYVALERGVVGMRVGGRRQITVSPHLTYYERARHPELPEEAVLRYEVTLLRVTNKWDNTFGGSAPWTKDLEAGQA